MRLFGLQLGSLSTEVEVNYKLGFVPNFKSNRPKTKLITHYSYHYHLIAPSCEMVLNQPSVLLTLEFCYSAL